METFTEAWSALVQPGEEEIEGMLKCNSDIAAVQHTQSLKNVSRSSIGPDGRAKMLLSLPHRMSSLPHCQSSVQDATSSISEAESTQQEDVIPHAVMVRGLEAQERLKCLRPAHSASRFIEDFLPLLPGGDKGDGTHLFQPHVSYDCKKAPACKRSFTAPASMGHFQPSEEYASSALLLRGATRPGTPMPLASYVSGTNTNASASSSRIEGLHLTSSFSDDGEDDKEEINEEEEENEGESIADYANRIISFSQSTYDLGDGQSRSSTTIPLPQISWFPEPPLSSFPNNASTSMSQMMPQKNRKNKSNLGKRPSTAPSTTMENGSKMGGWSVNLIGRGRPKINKGVIGYPVLS